jgi:hypothetical protein
MIPENVATSMPLEKLNSRTAAAFCSCESSRSLRIPARPLSAIPARQAATPMRITRPDALPAMATISPLTIGGTSVPNAAQYPSATATPNAMPR